ncbi:tripartite tricarboxylate transporter substrate binding protein [Metabacillus litoralis]|uniref:tripartite tricarboxylate transporter substrate binding protein n=1 Tax=Metabacillus litoralis TaxID=152268 RepID=UPI0020400A43|nr:tripartite tricarboxylate transporter substrate binding protein [Metabacillus litoralis]MCM3409294.1 tripartite tricarboxylate transporter substrate binding protein [Metabacillus litoralis]
MKKSFKGMLMFLMLILVAGIFAGCSQSTTNEGESSQENGNSSDYPSKPITVVVPAGAGGDTDANARLLGKYLEKELGQPVVISNVTGAGGTVGAKEVLDADPDGYTALFFHNSLLLNRIMGLTQDSYDSFKLAGIAVLDQGNTFMVSGDSKFENLQDMVEYARENPGEVSIATEVGGFTHLQLLALQKDQGIELNIVDVGGAAEKVTALLGGHVDIVPTSLGLVKDYVESGDMRTLGIMATDRVDLMPDVPTFVEQGVNSEFEKFFFFGFNPDTPDEIVDAFSKAVENVVNDEEYVKEAEKFLVTPTYMNSEEAFDYMKKTEEKYIEINKE